MHSSLPPDIEKIKCLQTPLAYGNLMSKPIPHGVYKLTKTKDAMAT